jgi:hypothetical protein
VERWSYITAGTHRTIDEDELHGVPHPDDVRLCWMLKHEGEPRFRDALPGYLLPDEISQQRGVIVNEDDLAADKAGVRD